MVYLAKDGGFFSGCETFGADVRDSLASEDLWEFAGGWDANLYITIWYSGWDVGEVCYVGGYGATTYGGTFLGYYLYDKGYIFCTGLFVTRFGFNDNAGLSGNGTTYGLYGAFLGLFTIGVEYYSDGFVLGLIGTIASGATITYAIGGSYDFF